MGLGAQATLLTVSSATPSEINTELKYIALITVPVIKTLPFGVPVAWPQPFRRFHFFESPRSIAVVSPRVVLLTMPGVLLGLLSRQYGTRIISFANARQAFACINLRTELIMTIHFSTIGAREMKCQMDK